MKRYVVGVVNGKSDVIIEDDATPVLTIAPGVTARDLWMNHSTPADLLRLEDPTKADSMIHEPPAQGAVFRIVRISPGAISNEDALKMHQKLNSNHVPSEADLAVAKDPSMHKTNSLNYMTVLSGKLWMLTEGRDVLLNPGDLVIQNGGIHGWRPEGDEPALLLGILIDANPV